MSEQPTRSAASSQPAKCGYRDEKGMYGRPLVCGRDEGHAGVHIDYTRFNGTVGFGSPGTKSVAFTEGGALPRVREEGSAEQRLADLEDRTPSAATDRLLTEDDSEIEVVDDEARAVWEKPQRRVAYTREDYERDKKAREHRAS